MGPKKPTEVPIPSLIRWSLLSAALFAAAVVGINLFVANWEQSLRDLEREEWYFVSNQAARTQEIKFRYLAHAAENHTKLLRRLAKPIISDGERRALMKEEAMYAHLVAASLRKVAGSAYLEVNEPPPGANVDALLSRKSDDEVAALAQASEDAFLPMLQKKKAQMVELDRRIVWYRYIATVLNAIQLFLLAYGQVGLFRIGRTPGA